jgi:hypothetical protein
MKKMLLLSVLASLVACGDQASRRFAKAPVGFQMLRGGFNETIGLQIYPDGSYRAGYTRISHIITEDGVIGVSSVERGKWKTSSDRLILEPTSEFRSGISDDAFEFIERLKPEDLEGAPLVRESYSAYVGKLALVDRKRGLLFGFEPKILAPNGEFASR